MASYTADQIQQFRQIFRDRSGDEGLRLEEFAPAVEACLRAAGLPEPPAHHLNSEFRRLSTTGTVSWQQFFQVLIHCNLSYTPGEGYQDEEVTPSPPLPPRVSNSASPPPPPPPPPPTTTTTDASPQPPPESIDYPHQAIEPASDGRRRGGGEGMGQPSRTRVGFVDTPDVVTTVVEYPGDAQPDQSTTWGQTIVRSGASLGRAIGNFFGLTDQSQFGSEQQAGWAHVGAASFEDNFVIEQIGRRFSFRSNVPDEPPPEYPGPPPAAVEGGGRSFDPTELGESSEEEEEEEDNLFIAPPPPDYQDIVGSDQPPPVPPHQSNTIVMAEIHSDPAGSQHPQQQQQTSNVGHFFNQSSTTALLNSPDDILPQQQQMIFEQTQRQYPPATRPAAQQPVSVTEGSIDFIYDPTDAWNYYLKFIKAERNLRQRRHHQGAFEFFGSIDAVESNANPTTAEVDRRGSIRRDRLGSASEPVQLRPRKKRKKNTKLQRQSTLVRHKVESLPSFTPWFIIVMSILQVIALGVLIGINEGVAPIGAVPRRNTTEFPSLSSNSTNATENITFYRAVNLWIGLPPIELIRIGAKFTPCMRRDFEIRDRNSEIYGDNRDSQGCCKNGDNVGTTIRTSDCACFSGNVNCTFNQGNISDIAYNTGTCTAGSATFHPCCVSITGVCLVIGNEECRARGGKFHPNLDTCLQVNCLEDVCGFNGANVGFDSGTPYLPKANQFWRFILSIFIHLGVIHIILIIPVQLYIGFKIERTIGWLRTGLIYLIAGVGGNILSGIFVPYGVNAGASGAVFGLIGVLFVELFQFWQIVDRAWLELLKLLGFVVFLLALGTLPFIDNMAHIGGLLFGVVAAIVFVPYITFGKLDAVRKRILLAICGPLLFLLFVSGFLTFYLIPNPSFCPGCGYINCFPYSSDFCPDEYRNARTEIYSL